MVKQPKPSTDAPQPVAYDTEGRPLYHHPPVQQTSDASSHPSHARPQYVHWTRPVAIREHEIPPEIQAKHEESAKKYPKLNLSKGEFVIKHVHRHPIGAVISGSISIFIVLVIGAVLIALPTMGGAFNLGPSQYVPLILIGGLLMLLVAIGGWIAVWVYNQNEFYLTNESVIQEIQHSLFSRHEQTVSLANIEDASYKQHGVMQYMFNYGLVRLSTKGDETTYRFPYASNPREQVAVLNNAVEAFKNGRPILSLEDMRGSRSRNGKAKIKP